MAEEYIVRKLNSGEPIQFPASMNEDDINSAVEKLNSEPMSSASNSNKPSAVEALGRGAMQGATLNFGDEIYGAYKGVSNALSNPGSFLDTLKETYQKERDAVREANKRAEQAHPNYYFGGELAGGVALPFGAAIKTAKTASSIAQPLARKTLAEATKEGAKFGAKYGSATSLGAAEGDPLDQAIQTGVGTVIGGGAGAIIPTIVKGASVLAEPILKNTRAIVQPKAEGTRRVAEAFDVDKEASDAVKRTIVKTPKQRAVEKRAQELIDQGLAGGDMRLVDVGGENVRALARSAANNSPSAREILSASADQTFTSQADRFYNFVRSKMSLPGNAAETKDTLQQKMRQVMRPLYKTAYDAGDKPLWTPTLERLAGSPMVRKAMERASESGKDRAIAEGFGGFNTRVQLAPDGVELKFVKGREGVPTYPNLQFWDYVKQELDEISTESSRQGSNKTSATAKEIAYKLRGELDKLVPEYAPARGVAANYFGADNALEAGEKFAKSTRFLPTNEATKLFNKMSPLEKQMFQEGYFSSLLENIHVVSDRHNLVNRFANSPAARKQLELVFGKDKALDVEAFLHIENLQDLMRKALGNSKTAQYLQEMALGGTGGFALSGGDFGNPKSTIYAALGALLLPAGSKAKNVMLQKMATHVAELLSSKDPRLVMRALNITRNNPTMMNMLRDASSRATQISTAATTAAETSPNFRGIVGSQMGMTADNLPQ